MDAQGLVTIEREQTITVNSAILITDQGYKVHQFCFDPVELYVGDIFELNLTLTVEEPCKNE